MLSKGKRSGLKDVASLAGVSTATVSRVLNGKGYASQEMRHKVLEAARQLHYQPNLQARSLRRRRSHSIGLLIPNLLNAYYTTLADAIGALLTERGYQLLLSATRDDARLEEQVLNQLIGHDVDGILWVPVVGDQARLGYLETQHTPAVSIVRKVEGNLIDTIVFGDLAGSQAATQHLIQLGHRRIGYIGGDIAYSSNYDRWQGYLAALTSAGLPADEHLVRLGAVRSDWGATATAELMHLPELPTALFVGSNAIFPGVIKVLRQFALGIPEQISLICFDDLDWFSYSDPPISAVATSPNLLAEAAVDLLLRRVEEPTGLERPPEFRELSFELVLRRSTAPP